MKTKKFWGFLIVAIWFTYAWAFAADQASSFQATVTHGSSGVQFSVQGDNFETIHVQVLGLDGRALFDSGWVVGQNVTWPMLTLTGKSIANGVYLYSISVRDHDGQEHHTLGKLTLVYGLDARLSVPSVGQLSGVEPSAAQFPLPNGTLWRQRFGADRSDTLRVQRKSPRLPGGPVTNFENILQLEADGKLRVKELCLGTGFAPVTNLNPDNLDTEGECRSAWGGTGGGSGTPSGWVDDGSSVRLASIADKVGIGTTSPTEKLTVAGNIDVTGPMSKISFNYATLADLPSASTYHGMLAHVHAAGKAYFAHAGSWVPLANELHTHSLADLANQDCGAGMAIRGWTGGTLSCVSVGGSGASSGWLLAGNATIDPATNFLGTTDNQPLVFKTNGTERMRIDTSGKVGIGTTTPCSKARLYVFKAQPVDPLCQDAAVSVSGVNGGGFGVFGQSTSVGVFGVSEDGPGVRGNSRVGPGVDGNSVDGPGIAGIGRPGVLGTGQGANWGVAGTSDTSDGVNGFSNSGTGVRGEGSVGVFGLSSNGNGVSGSSTNGTGVRGDSTNYRAIEGYATGDYGVFGASTNSTGVVARSTFGTYIIEGYEQTNRRFAVERTTGNVKADGAFQGGGVDYADILPIMGKSSDYEPGDVLVIGPDGKLIKSREPYSMALAGVYSTKPAFIGDPRGLTEDSAPTANDLVPVALVGLVPVKVSAENGAIHPGDLITTSSTPGYAMKATDPKIGTVLGKAMQSLERGTGMINVLVTLR